LGALSECSERERVIKDKRIEGDNTMTSIQVVTPLGDRELLISYQDRIVAER
jgi:hypothetical protein